MEAETKYKRYENQLINLRKQCHQKQLNQYQSSWIFHWQWQNSEWYEVVNGFNVFIVNVGPQLAGKINDTHSKVGEVVESHIARNPSSIYLKPVETTEIIDIINSCKNKTSTDWNVIDMTLLKKVIDGIANPLTYICNLSFTTIST